MSNVDVSVKVKNHKCFRDEFAGFEKIKPVNIIIGRNNSGKSSMLDILEFVVDPRSERKAILQIEDEISEKKLRSVFSERISGGELGGNHWSDHGQYLVGLRVRYHLPATEKYEIINPELFETNLSGPNYQKGRIVKARRGIIDNIITDFQNGKRVPEFFKGRTIRRLLAERDIKNEGSRGNVDLNPNGDGATNIIRRYILSSNLDRDLIKEKLLDSLNHIFNPDNKFEEIIIQQHEESGDQYEIYFDEKSKGLVPLSGSGSGLKTVILVLLNLLVIPKDQDNLKLENYLFAFEELENNIHPALLRRLFKYIEDFAVKNKCYFFITTHSNVVIDIFSYSENAQIIHVTHDGIQATTTTIDSFSGHSGVLDDLGVKASDILQANGIVWLEGPSDRIYFNKWVELYSNGELREHRDYECALYGGSILAHFEAAEPDEQNDAVNILRVNRNAILMGDSDKTSSRAKLKKRLERIQEEVERMGAYAWVTDTKEVENYIPAEVLNKVFNKKSLPEIGQYEVFHQNDDGYWQNNKLKGSFDKVKLARKVVPFLTKENLKSRFDNEEQMETICEKIKRWNTIKPTIKEENET